MFVLKILKILLCPPKEPKQRKQIIFIFKNKNSYGNICFFLLLRIKNSYIKSMNFIPKKRCIACIYENIF